MIFAGSAPDLSCRKKVDLPAPAGPATISKCLRTGNTTPSTPLRFADVPTDAILEQPVQNFIFSACSLWTCEYRTALSYARATTRGCGSLKGQWPPQSGRKRYTLYVP